MSTMVVPDAVLLADNLLSQPGEISGYLVVSIGKGLSVAYRGAF